MVTKENIEQVIMRLGALKGQIESILAFAEPYADYADGNFFGDPEGWVPVWMMEDLEDAIGACYYQTGDISRKVSEWKTACEEHGKEEVKE